MGLIPFLSPISIVKQIVCTMDQDFVKKRLEKDLEDLKRMIALHFEQRKKDESELEELKSRIDKRKQMRKNNLDSELSVNVKDKNSSAWKKKEKPKKKPPERPKKNSKRRKLWLPSLPPLVATSHKPNREQTKPIVKRRRRNFLNAESHLTLTIFQATKSKKRLTKCTNIFASSKKRDP